MKNFRISHFEKLDARPLHESVDGLRAITERTGLSRDILVKIAELREA